MSSLEPVPGWARNTGHITVGALDRVDADSAADRLAIAERVHLYGWGYDERDRDLLADCFTEDGTWEGHIMGIDSVGPPMGRDAVVEFLTAFWDEQTDQRRHIFTNVVVSDLTGTSGVAHAYLLLTASTGGEMKPVTNGPYRLEMRKAAGIWRISRLAAGFDAPF
ncbi:MAG: nuclear transport factor 2 family protein [Acidimicrobiia bacterium]|nr:nuclear transport factor 2 family protein [Acidimicrobiia bacterium]